MLTKEQWVLFKCVFWCAVYVAKAVRGDLDSAGSADFAVQKFDKRWKVQ